MSKDSLDRGKVELYKHGYAVFHYSEQSSKFLFCVNSQDIEAEVKVKGCLVDFIRKRLDLTGTKRACDTEIGGASTVFGRQE